eukprot:gene7850-8699_t
MLKNANETNSAKTRIHARFKEKRVKQSRNTVVIWGKAAIGLYLWKHIFEAPLENVNGQLEQYGEINIDDVNLKFRTGVMIKPETIDRTTQNAVLIINGREEKKIEFAKNWLESLKKFENLKNLGVILLGNEQCNNEWLMNYMITNGGMVKFAFIVYDIPYVDNKMFLQWPLGVATYRQFPVIHEGEISGKGRRKYLCNFLGTVYKNSSRQELVNIINANSEIKSKCFMHLRYDWLPHETKKTRELYQNVLRNSDLTLCPVGINTECYRLYEALSYGSVPIVEDVMTTGHCGASSSFTANDQTPLRILKELKAPLVYIKSWKELPGLIRRESQLSEEFVFQRRKQILEWYQKFRYKLRNKFLKQLKSSFEI